MSWEAAGERMTARSLVRQRRAGPSARRPRLVPATSVPARSALSVLASDASTGDPAATETLLAKVRDLVHRYCRARLGTLPASEHAVEDAVQEVCLNVLHVLPGYRAENGAFEALIYTLASRRVADQQRIVYRAPVPVGDIPDEVEIDPTPEEVALASEDAQRARDLLSHLPEAHRELLILRIAVGMSADEVADAMQMTPGAVRVAQHRALSKLRVLAGEGGGR